MRGASDWSEDSMRFVESRARLMSGLFFRRQIERYGLVLKMFLVRTVTERLIFRKTASAKRDDLPASQPIYVPVLVHYFKIPFYL
jgi:hypothetical protein